jgi:hypothetical protein
MWHVLASGAHMSHAQLMGHMRCAHMSHMSSAHKDTGMRHISSAQVVVTHVVRRCW